MGRRFAPGLGLLLLARGTIGDGLKPKKLWWGLLLERDGKTRGRFQRPAVDRLDVDSQDLGGIIGLLCTVKTGRLPLEVKIVLEEPGILLDVGDATVRARARCKVTVPFLGEVNSIQGQVGSTTRFGLCIRFEAQNLRRGERGLQYFCCLKWALLWTRHHGSCDQGQDIQRMER